jgi:hypothetical protein
VTFATPAIPGSAGREFLVLGSDDKQIAVVMAPDAGKGDGPPVLYIARSELKVFSVKRRDSLSAFTHGRWRPLAGFALD